MIIFTDYIVTCGKSKEQVKESGEVAVCSGEKTNEC